MDELNRRSLDDKRRWAADLVSVWELSKANWNKLLQVRTEWLIAPSPSELMSLLFEDGFSIADIVSETSGRAVGLRAIQDICKGLGGMIALHDTARASGRTSSTPWKRLT
jgi:hypothetical protein